MGDARTASRPPTTPTHSRRSVPHAEVEVLEHCGHYPQLELPTRVTRLLDEFLSEKRKPVRATRNGNGS